MLIKIHVLPRSSRSEVAGEMANGDLKVKLTSAPVDGKANEELITVLAKHYGTNKNNITIKRGNKGKNKLIEIK